jgi:hypothetical protein
VHTMRYKDFPLIRRLLPSWVFRKFVLGISRDRNYETWSRERDRVLRQISPVLDPLARPRMKARLSIRRWLSYFYRTSSCVLDYDFLPPDAFVAIIKKADLAHRQSSSSIPLSLVAIGHVNNSHTAENLERTLVKLREEFGQRIQFKTLQQVTEEQLVKNGTQNPSLENNPIAPSKSVDINI